MKKIIIITVLLLLAMSYSCSEDFFTLPPIASTSEVLFYNEKGVEALLIGVYAVIGPYSVGWGSSPWNWTWGSVASDEAYKGSEESDQSPINEIERWRVMTTNTYPGHKWAMVYRGVTRANDVIRIIESAGIEEPARTRFLAEARFLRAYFNFEGWMVFKNIPIITEETEKPEMVTNTVDIYPHIIDDLTFAMNNLPETQTQVQRPTRYAAMGYAVRTHMQVLNYDAAKPLCDAIINSGRYSLAPNYWDNWRIATNNNFESIFELQCSVNDPGTLNATLGMGICVPMGGDIGMNSGFFQPSQTLVNAHRVDADGLPMFDTYNDVDLKNDQGISSFATFVPFDDEVDPRLDWTVSRRGIPYHDWGVNRGNDWINTQADGGPYLPVPKYFMRQDERAQYGARSGWQTGVNANNFPILRLSHILLWRAEIAAYENNLELARTYVNMIRERAGNEVVMGRVYTYELPPAAYPWNVDIDWDEPAANYKIGLYPAFANRAEAMRSVQFEHFLEFAMEGQRFFDLRRWDDLPAELNFFPMSETLNSFQQADLRIRRFMSGENFTDRARLAPIPQVQIDLTGNDILIQNPGY